MPQGEADPPDAMASRPVLEYRRAPSAAGAGRAGWPWRDGAAMVLAVAGCAMVPLAWRADAAGVVVPCLLACALGLPAGLIGLVRTIVAEPRPTPAAWLALFLGGAASAAGVFTLLSGLRQF